MSPPSPRVFRIRCDVIEQKFGPGNFDDAGDAMVEALREAFEHSKTAARLAPHFTVAFDFDSSHPNPWHHTMVVTFGGVPDEVHRGFCATMTRMGLWEPGTSG